MTGFLVKTHLCTKLDCRNDWIKVELLELLKPYLSNKKKRVALNSLKKVSRSSWPEVLWFPSIIIFSARKAKMTRFTRKWRTNAKATPIYRADNSSDVSNISQWLCCHIIQKSLKDQNIVCTKQFGF